MGAFSFISYCSSQSSWDICTDTHYNISIGELVSQEKSLNNVVIIFFVIGPLPLVVHGTSFLWVAFFLANWAGNFPAGSLHLWVRFDQKANKDVRQAVQQGGFSGMVLPVPPFKVSGILNSPIYLIICYQPATDKITLQVKIISTKIAT